MNKFIIISLVGLVICTIILLLIAAPMFDEHPTAPLGIILLSIFGFFWLLSFGGFMYHVVRDRNHHIQIIQFLDTDEEPAAPPLYGGE